MDTKLEASCEFSNCTLLKSPDANILSPIAMSLTGVFGNMLMHSERIFNGVFMIVIV